LATAALGIVVGGLVWITTDFGKKQAPTEKPPAKSVTTGPSAADILALELGTQRSDFGQQLAHADESLQSVSGKPYPEASLGAAINDDWKGHAQSAASDLSHLEDLWSIDKPTSHSLKGQKP
jgi:hypothetical protein